jgi:hypothetical protein
VPEGATALIKLSLRIVYAAGLAPKNVPVAVVNPVPVIVTLLPPAIAPPVGDKLVRVGATTYWNIAPLLVAAAVSTVTALAPATPAGEVAVTELSELTVKAAGVVPKYTPRVSIKPAPVMVTVVPPVVCPAVGAMELITGAGWKLKLSELSVPPEVVILIGTVPARCAGETAVILPSSATEKLVAGVVPKFTLVVPVKPVPVIATLSPPAVIPVAGNTSVGAGAARYV